MTHSCMNRAVQIGPPPRHHTLDKKAALWAIILYIDNNNIRAAEGHTYTNNVAGLFFSGSMNKLLLSREVGHVNFVNWTG